MDLTSIYWRTSCPNLEPTVVSQTGNFVRPAPDLWDQIDPKFVRLVIKHLWELSGVLVTRSFSSGLNKIYFKCWSKHNHIEPYKASDLEKEDIFSSSSAEPAGHEPTVAVYPVTLPIVPMSGSHWLLFACRGCTMILNDNIIQKSKIL